MLNQKENIRNRILDTILVVLFLLFVLSLSNNPDNHTAKNNKPDISNEIVVSQSNAVIYSGITLKIQPKSWISGIKYPCSINPDKKIISENKKTDHQISIQKDSIAYECKVPIFFFHYHFFATEKDDLPFLS
jgi:hypothetical protein